MLKIRLRRTGARKKPNYRVVIAEATAPRDGRYLEIIGFYNPLTEPSTVRIDGDKARHWLDHGAQPTDRVAKLLAREGIIAPIVWPTAASTEAETPAPTDTPAPAAAPRTSTTPTPEVAEAVATSTAEETEASASPMPEAAEVSVTPTAEAAEDEPEQPATGPASAPA